METLLGTCSRWMVMAFRRLAVGLCSWRSETGHLTVGISQYPQATSRSAHGFGISLMTKRSPCPIMILHGVSSPRCMLIEELTLDKMRRSALYVSPGRLLTGTRFESGIARSPRWIPRPYGALPTGTCPLAENLEIEAAMQSSSGIQTLMSPCGVSGLTASVRSHIENMPVSRLSQTPGSSSVATNVMCISKLATPFRSGLLNG